MILKKAYHEIMERIAVTDDMRERIIKNLSAANFQKSLLPKSTLTARKWLAVAAALVMVFAGLAAVYSLWNVEPELPSNSVNTVPDIAEVSSEEELSSLVGFSVCELTELPFEAESIIYTAYWQSLAQIRYSGENQTLTFRQAKGTEDVSGDYTMYESVTEKEVNGWQVAFKGQNDQIQLAIWSDGEFSYSLSFAEPLSQLQAEELIQQIH